MHKQVVAFIGVLVGFATSLSAQPGGDRATPIKAGEECPPGTTEIRPRSCLGPQEPAPSILDYRPKSTLVVPEHLVKKARYPAIDFHGHPFEMLGSVESLARMGTQLDAINVRMIIVANNVSGDPLKQMMATIRSSPAMKDRVRVSPASTFETSDPDGRSVLSRSSRPMSPRERLESVRSAKVLVRRFAKQMVRD